MARSVASRFLRRNPPGSHGKAYCKEAPRSRCPVPPPETSTRGFAAAHPILQIAPLLIPFRIQERNVRTVAISGVPPTVLVIICHALLGERLHRFERA